MSTQPGNAHARYTADSTGASSQGTASAHHPARITTRWRDGVPQEKTDFPRYLLRLTELELLDRDRRATERRIRQARFPVVKGLDSFDFLAIPSLNKTLVLELARCEFLSRKENLLLLGNSGTGKSHVALALGLAAFVQRGHRVRFTTAAALVSELIEARDEKHLLRFQKQLAAYELLIVDELGYVPLSKTGAELLFETFSQRYERASTLVTSNLPSRRMDRSLRFREADQRPARPAYPPRSHPGDEHADSYRLKQSRRKRNPPADHMTLNRASGEKGLFRYAPEPFLPRKQPHPQPISGSLWLRPRRGLLLLRP